MRKNTDNLTAKQRMTLAAVLAGKTRQEAADAAGVHVGTVYRWLADDSTFQSELANRGARILDSSIATLQGLTESAVRTLDRNLKCGKPAIEVRAALGVFSLAVRLRDGEIRDRVERLEALLNEDDYDFSEFRTLHSKTGKENECPHFD